MQESQKDIIHSVTNQFTYIKKLDFITNVNVEAISNLSRIIKENVIQSHEKLQQTARDILFLNLTIHGQSTLFTTIRQLEFTLLRFTQHIDELINAVQHIITGKLPLSLVSPPTLLNILKNISLHLPEGYELITGTKLKDIHLYYDTIQTAIIGDPYHIKIILNVPLKQANRHFVLYKILALPIQISNGTFAQYLPEFLYLEQITFSVAISCLQRLSLAIAHRVILQYAPLTKQYTADKYYPVKLVYSSRLQTASAYVAENCCYTTPRIGHEFIPRRDANPVPL